MVSVTTPDRVDREGDFTMDIKIAIVLGLMASSAAAADPSSLPPPAPAGQHWVSVPALTDEFAGRELDEAKWMPKHAYWSGRPPSRFAEANVTVEGGLLTLRSTVDRAALAKAANPDVDIWVNSACISSRGALAGPGYYAARVRASRLSMTSSFWLQGKQTEIDVVEQIGASILIPDHGWLMASNTHYFPGGWAKGDQATPSSWRLPTPAAAGFHVYGVWWKDAQTLWFYHDGNKVMEVTPKGPFDEPQWMFFDTEVFLGHGLPTVESLADPAGNAMQVDWVRSWELAADLPTP